MSQENVEIVRRVYDAAARHDAATVLTLYDPEVELDASWLQVAGLAGRGVYRGTTASGVSSAEGETALRTPAPGIRVG